MFGLLWAVIDLIKRRVSSFLGWCRDPWSGSRMTRPFTRDYTRTGESLIYIFIHRTGSAIYSVLYVLIFDGLATVAQFVVGVFSDLWHSDYRYGRYAVALLAAGIKTAILGIISGVVFVATLVKSMLFEK
ncbi:hypothetical protein HTG_18965 [Natrinema mahii]|nr:hypothetical protein HTG_18965 [Natrinema mahii]